MSASISNQPQVLAGLDDWLFLREGTNRSLSYLNGDLPVAAGTEQSWRKTLVDRQKLFPDCLHLICPEKLAVFPENLPGFQLDNARFAERLSSSGSIIYPVRELHEVRVNGAYSYSKTDTHFSDLGALVTANLVATHFDIQREIHTEWTTQSIVGDLGMKMDPVVRSEKLLLSTPLETKLYDNGLNNRGRMLFLSSCEAPGGRLLLFGDSFSGINLSRMLAIYFREVLFVHSLAVDYKVVERFAPDFILFQFAERFLRDDPSDGLSIESLVVKKMLQNQEDKVRSWQADTENPTHHFVDWNVIDYLSQGR